MPRTVSAWAPARASSQRARDDARGWLQKQITGSRPLPEDIRRLPSSADVFKTYSELRRERNDAKSDSEAAKRLLGGLRAKLAPYYLDQVAARYRVAVQTDESFRERLVHFWTNHFAVSADKPQVLALAGTLENEAIRPHVAGRFADMLAAVEAHPAMILYLDNQASIGPARSSRSVAAGARRPAIASSASTRTWRAKSSSCTRSASMAATRSRTSRRSRARSPAGRSAPTGFPAAASSASSRSTTPRTSRAQRPSSARATVNQASRSRAPC